jgi:hypothetical protein
MSRTERHEDTVDGGGDGGDGNGEGEGEEGGEMSSNQMVSRGSNSVMHMAGGEVSSLQLMI